MKFHRKFLLVSFTVLYLFNLAWNGLLYTLPANNTIWNFTYNLSYGLIFFIGCIVSMIFAFTFGLKSNLGKMLFFFGLGLISYWLGNIVWFYYTLVAKVDVPFPSFADLFYSIIYPSMCIACIYLLKIYKTLISKSLLRDSVLIFILSFFIIFAINGQPDLSANLDFWQKFFNVYYPAGDVFLLSIALIAVRVGGGKLHPSLYLLAFGLVLHSAADLFFVYRTANDIYWNGDISDLLFTSAAYFMSIGVFGIIDSLNQVQATPVVAPKTLSYNNATDTQITKNSSLDTADQDKI